MYIAIAAGVFVVLALAVVWFIRRARSRGGGPVSIAMLRASHRPLTEAHVRAAAADVFGSSLEVARIELPGGHGFGFLMISKAQAAPPPIAVICCSRTYTEPGQAEELGGTIEEPRVRDALMQHKAWISVDAMGVQATPDREEFAPIYNVLGKIAAKLFDSGCILLYLPAHHRIALPKPDTATLLADDRVLEVFGDDELHTPVLQAKAGDRRMQAATDEARKRFPEFVSAFEREGESLQGGVKGAFTSSSGETEYMWVKVSRITSTGVEGENMNSPIRKDLPGKGARVTLRHDEIFDWIYVDEQQQPQGGFLERLLHASR